MKAIFTNGAELEYLNALETEEYWGGSNRRTLTFTCAPDAVSIDALNAVLSDMANTQRLSLTDTTRYESGENTVTNYYDGYTMKLAVGIDKVLVQPDSPDSPAVYEDRLVFKLGRPTAIEAALAKLGIPIV